LIDSPAGDPYTARMFTGLVEDVGEVTRAEHRAGSLRLTVRTRIPTRELTLGDSIAVDGACYTAVALHDAAFEVDVGPESLSKTLAGEYKSGSRVNLERALAAGARLGGHFVLGHVDAMGTVQQVRQRGDAWDFVVKAPGDVIDLTPPKGSITINGISLTVNAVHQDSFEVSIIPHTWSRTTLAGTAVGARVHLETDVLARTVKWLLQRRGVLPGETPVTPESGGVTMEILKKNGFI